MSFSQLYQNLVNLNETYDSTSDTLVHRELVSNLINTIIAQLEDRANIHDASKLESPEKEAFDQVTPKLKNLEYGSQEYKDNLDSIRPAINHHYSINRHHPEFFENSVNGMNLIDLIEMLADWKASTKRSESGDINRSLQVNFQRFGIDAQLAAIITNTIKDMGWE